VSPAGPAGRIAGRLLDEALREHAAGREAHERAFRGALAAAAAELSRRLERVEALLRRPPLPPGLGAVEAVECATDVGPLLLHAADAVMTPHIRATGSWEPDMAAHLRRSLRPGMTFVDVGAHVGYFSVLASALVGPRGRVVAVEPEPGNAALLRANLWRNGCANAVVLEVAAHDRQGHLPLARNSVNRGGSNLLGGGDLLVPCAALDDLLDALGPPAADVVKVDAEGTDHLVLRGMARALARPGASVAVEVLPDLAALGGDPVEAVLDYYWSLPLERHLLEPGGALRPVATPQEVLAAGADADWLNLVLVRP
jgi:FkbM family methyltransferase